MIRLYDRWREAAALAMAALVLTGCASTPEEPSGRILVRAGEKLVVHPDGTAVLQGREVIIPSDPEARLKYEAYRAEQAEEERAKAEAEKADLRERRYNWMKDPAAQPVLDWLCALTPGTPKYDAEIFKASGELGIVPKRNPAADENAEQRGYALLDCKARASSRATE